MSKPITLNEYYGRAGSRFSDKDARIVGPELDRLAVTGGATAERVVEEARPETSTLHPYFTWDERRAAELYRQQEARIMLNSIEVEAIREGGERVRVPKFVHVEVSREEREAAGLESSRQSPYVTFERVVGEGDKIGQKKEQARRELLHWQARFSLWAACSEEFQATFAPVFDAIAEVEKASSA